MTKIAVYPGTFDPVTYGHLDVIRRVSSLFDKVFVAVASGTHKNVLFSVDERIGMLKEVVTEFDNVTVESFNGLVVDCKREVRQCRCQGPPHDIGF